MFLGSTRGTIWSWEPPRARVWYYKVKFEGEDISDQPYAENHLKEAPPDSQLGRGHRERRPVVKM